MKHGSYRVVWLLVLAAALTMVSAPAFAQGASTTSSLAGQVADTSGGVIPGADVVAKHVATGAEARAVTNAEGKFTIPALPPGTYHVTISLMGFKTVTLPDVQVSTGAPAQIKTIVLEVGKLEETVVVTGATEIVQTQTASVTTTLTTRQINSAPLPTRNTLDFVAMLPGVNTTGSIRNSTVMGLGANATNITIDGINTQDNYLKSSDGFFSRINPRMDAVEEVSASTSNPGAESAGQGAVQIRFQTRQGTNKFQGSAYWYNRNTAYNTNYWFNKRDGLPKEIQNINTAGFRVGGPVVIPKLFDGHDKLFFFFNYEDWRPGTQTTSRARTVLTAPSLAGNFVYGTSGQYSVNLFDLMSTLNSKVAGTKDANGTTWVPVPTSTAGNPIIMGLLGKIDAARASGNVTTGTTVPAFATLNWQATSTQFRRYPTTRVDFNVTPRNRVGVSYYWQRYYSFPDTLNSYDPSFPGFPGAAGQVSDRWSWMANWRSTFTSNMVNEVRGGMTGGPVGFNYGVSKATFTDPNYNMAGWQISWPLLTRPDRSANSNYRDAPTRVLEDSLSWIKGKHAINMGASFTQILLDWPNNYWAPGTGFGYATGDPLSSYFNTGNIAINGVSLGTIFPNATSADVGNAASLYALLTGRMSSVSYTGYLGADGKYHVPDPAGNPANAYQQAHENELGLFVQDAWKLRPNLTLNYGVRWEMQFPFVADNLYYTKLVDSDMIYGASGKPTGGVLFTPGVLNGITPAQTTPLGIGKSGFQTDWNNLAPSVGIAWKPQINSPLLKKILSADPVVRGGYSIAYMREGMSAVSGIYSYNPGGTVDLARTTSTGTWVTPGSVFFGSGLRTDQGGTIPLPFDKKSGSLVTTDGQVAPVYPMTATYSDSLNTFAPDTQVPYTHSWNFGLQRTLDKNTAIEVRYVGNRSRNGWVIGGRNLNEANITGQSAALGGPFIDEFKRAQGNLQANIAANAAGLINPLTNKVYTANSIAYGAPGTSPLPVFMAFIAGKTLASGAANNPANYTGTNWTNTTYMNNMGLQNPSATGVAGSLWSNLRNNALSAGLPMNYFFMVGENYGGGSYITGRPEDYSFRRYDAIQVEIRRRMANGLLIQGSYQNVIRNNSSNNYTLYAPLEYVTTSVPTHVLKLNWSYELPFGQGKRFGSGVGRGLNHVIGGWSFDGNGRIQSGNRLDFGNVRLVNMTDQQFQDMFYLRFVNDAQGKPQIYFLPEDVINNTMLALNNTAYNNTGFAGAAPDPNARYIARQNGPNCIPSYSGDPCGGVRHHYVFGPAFMRFDMALAKRIYATSRVYVDFRAEAMNVFNNINFTGTTGTGTALSSFQLGTGGAYRDSSNTQDPGGRLLQFSLRVSW